MTTTKETTHLLAIGNCTLGKMPLTKGTFERKRMSQEKKRERVCVLGGSYEDTFGNIQFQKRCKSVKTTMLLWKLEHPGCMEKVVKCFC